MLRMFEIAEKYINGKISTPLYVALIVDDNTEKSLNENLDKEKDFNDEYHVTILYSKKGVEIEKDKLNKDFPLEVPIVSKVNGYKIFEPNENEKTFVLTLDCMECVKLHEELMEKYKASFDYDEYIPHVTIYYNYDLDTSPEEFYKRFENMEIIFDKIRYEPIDENKYKE